MNSGVCFESVYEVELMVEEAAAVSIPLILPLKSCICCCMEPTWHSCTSSCKRACIHDAVKFVA